MARLIIVGILCMFAFPAHAQRATRDDLVAAIAQRIASCVNSKWEVVDDTRPQGAVRLRLAYNKDGSLREPPRILDPQNSPQFQMTAHSAIAAVYGCAPISLPPEHYELWKVIVIKFDPAAARRTRAASITRPAGITRSTANDEFGRSVYMALAKALPHLPRNVTVAASLRLSPKGAVEELKITRSSGDKRTDDSMLTTIPKAVFPLPPADATDADRTFTIHYANAPALKLR